MTVSNGLTIQKMIALRNLLALLSMLQVKHVSPVILIVFTFLTLTPKDLSGMKFAAKRLTTITQSPQLPGNMMDLKFLLVPFVVQLIFLMFVSKNAATRANSSSPMSHFPKCLSLVSKMDRRLCLKLKMVMKSQKLMFTKIASLWLPLIPL